MNFKNYFELRFDKPFTYTATWSGKTLSKGKLEILNKDLETVIVNELNNPSENDLKAIEKISKVLNNV